ncbi:dipeptide/oligopeptide/nickel ABC transporter permease/ATP-binding protein [Microbacterium sp. No. 7]|uniref:dipeptide/oligopeptide/nickel ABC transporter permease/ATP-binding protein n=1 Tax=Microbacterium sp. No. 7 TaxID=1714373 RepID=UPI0006CF5F55|nr:dipeptide/oligopeptide/nickel ABC transporter permease/ATP-binding protein [Microbacterium sp. No. 7]ALJ21860.1 peptide ABC transporter ATP-binding protein [Microbacterium sp. No. 7]
MTVDTALATSRRTAPRPPGRLRWNATLAAGTGLLAVIVVAGIVAPLLLSDAANQLTTTRNAPPSAEHWLGTDAFGRDLLARALVATRLTLLMTLAATAIAVCGGVLLGIGIWLAPRRVREISLRVLETAVSYPGLLVALVISAILGAGAFAVVVAIGLANLPAFGRLAANLSASLSQREFVSTARLLGVPLHRMLAFHLLPHMIAPLAIVTASCFAVGMMEMSGLSFVGLGVQAPDYDFGKLLNDALPSIYTRPYEVVGPTLMIVLTILAVMLIGDGFAGAANPYAGRAGHTTQRRAHRAPTTSSPGSLVEVADLTVTAADGTTLVREVSFTMRQGEILGVVGESGSGKSTIAMSLARLLPPSLRAEATTLRIGDLDLLDEVDDRQIATDLALVYQDPGSTFNPALRMASQLTEVLRRHRGASRRHARAIVLSALRAVRLRDPERCLRQFPYELSGGMRQRAMLAAAIASGPRLLIADEPTTALDVTVQASVLRELVRLNRERDLAVLFVSHDMGVVQALCDRVLVVRSGEIVEELSGDRMRAGEARHPYTRTLLAATPRWRQEEDQDD